MLFLFLLFAAAIVLVLIFAVHLLPILLIVGAVLLVFALAHRCVFGYDPRGCWWHRDWPWRHDHRRW